MLRKLRLLIGGRAKLAQALANDRPAMSIEEIMDSFPPMKPVQPPSAVNDDFEVELYDLVEQGLHAAGMLDHRHG